MLVRTFQLAAMALIAVAAALVAAGGTAEAQVDAYHAGFNHVRNSTTNLTYGVPEPTLSACDPWAGGPSYPVIFGQRHTCAWDGNASSHVAIVGGDIHPGDPDNCGNQAGQGNANFSVEWRFPGNRSYSIDHMRVNFSMSDTGGGSGSLCVFTLDTPEHIPVCGDCTAGRTRIVNDNAVVLDAQKEKYVNVTKREVYGIMLRAGHNGGACACTVTLRVFELEAFERGGKNYTMTWALADQLASTMSIVNDETTVGGSFTHNWRPGTTIVYTAQRYMASSSAAVTNSTVDPYKLDRAFISSNEDFLNASHVGWGLMSDDINATGDRCFTSIWRVTNNGTLPVSGNMPITSGGVAAENACVFAEAGLNRTFSGTYTDWRKVTATTNLTIALMYQESNVPLYPTTDDVFGGQDITFNEDNLTLGPSVLSAPWTQGSSTFTVGPDLRRWAGNGFYLLMAQGSASTAQATQMEITVNGRPAAHVGNPSPPGGEKVAVFYIDDVATRNGVGDRDGTYYQGNARPFNAESYVVTPVRGFDPANPVYLMRFSGADGHVTMMCAVNGFCASNVDAIFHVSPSNFTNNVRFKVVDSSGAGLGSVNIRDGNNTTIMTTLNTGWLNMTNVFHTAYYTVTKPGYAATCATFYFQSTGSASTGTDARPCKYVKATSANFTVTLFNASEAGESGDGSVTVDPTPTLAITFFGNTTRVVPNNVTVLINRTISVDLVVDCARTDSAGGVRSACQADAWLATDSNTYSFSYPQSVRTTTTNSDAGTYLLFVTNASGAMRGSRPFAIGATWTDTAGKDVLVVGSDLEQQLGTDTLQEFSAAEAARSQAATVTTETSVRQHWLNAMDMALDTFGSCDAATPEGKDQIGCKVPNIAWWYLGTLIVAAVGVAKGRRLQ